MKVDEQSKTIRLSRRNLETGLRKLDGYPADSACTLLGGDGALGWTLIFEDNDEHYADRPAGAMVADTEVHISKPDRGVLPATTLGLVVTREP